jgi:hypothetical protein
MREQAHRQQAPRDFVVGSGDRLERPAALVAAGRSSRYDGRMVGVLMSKV